MKKALLAVLFCLIVGFVSGQVNGNYRSRQTGNWNEVTTWQVFNEGVWNDLEAIGAGVYRNITPSSVSGVITISSNTSITIPIGISITADQIEFGSVAPMPSLIVSGTLSINNGAGNDIRLYNNGVNFSLLQVSGTLRLLNNATIVNDNYAGTISAASNATTVNTYQVLNGGTHIHYSSDGLPYADWQIGSTIHFIAINKSPVITDVSVEFFNFVWDGTETIGTGQSGDLNFLGRLRQVNGNFTVLGTNNRYLYFGSSHTYTLNILGNVVIENGSLVYFNSIGSATLNIGTVSTPGNFQVSSGSVNLNFSGNTTFNLFGDFLPSGGTVNLRAGSSSGGNTNVNIFGNFSQTGGSILRSGGNSLVNLNFTGSGTSTFTQTAGTITTPVNYTVANGKTLELGTSVLTGAGGVTLFTGSTLRVKSLDAGGAIQNNTTGGNIRVSGIRTYQSGSTIVYDGAGPQFIGPGHPAAASTTVNNPSNVSLVSDVTINGALSLVNGLLSVESNTLTLGGAFSRTDDGAFGVNGTSSMVINGTGNFVDLVFSYTLPGSNINNLTINRSGGTVFLGASVNVNGNFTQTAGIFSLGQFNAFTLALRGNVAQSGGGAIAAFNNSSLIIEGAGTLPTNLNMIGPDILTLTMNRGGGTLRTTSVLTLRNLNLFNGVVDNPALTLAMGSGGIVTRYSTGSVTNVLGTIGNSSYDVIYDIDFDIETGNELPFIDEVTTSLGNLTKLGPATLFLHHPIFINGSFDIVEGEFFGDLNNNITIARNFNVDGIFTTQSTVTFGGEVPQSISGSGSIAFFDLEVDQTTPTTLNLSAAISVENSLAINSANSVMNAGSNLMTLLSTPLSTANVNPLATGASITGSVIVQRYLPKVVLRRDHHYMASPVINSTLADWGQELPLGRSYRWNEPTQAWVRISSATVLTNGRGFLVDPGGSGTFTYDSRGPLAQGNVNVPLVKQSAVIGGYEGMNLVGNPYPSAIDWDNVTVPANVNNAVYFRDNFGNSGQGTQANILVSYVDDVGTPLGYSGAIAQGQAFFVRATANATLTFTEAAKILPTNTQFFRKAEIPNVLRITLNGQDVKDEAVIRLREGATDKFDGQFDAYKVFKNKVSIASLTSDHKEAVINAFNTSECSKIIPLVAEGMQPGTYTLNFVGMESFDSFMKIELLDLVEKSTINIRKLREYSFTVTDQNTDSISSRFQISIEGPTPAEEVSLTANGTTLISSSENGNQWYLDGELLEGATSNTLQALESGLYTVNVTKGGCTNSASFEMTGLGGETGFGISISPNPTANKVLIRVKTTNNNVMATLVNTQGVELDTKALVGDGSVKQTEFDMLTYATGIYNVRIWDGQKVTTKKIVKIK